MKVAKLLLYPLAALYNLATQFRNYLYDIGHKASFQFDVTVIAVGNLNVGGSGKTPMVEYLIQMLKKKHMIATLSRGYKRETEGYRLASPSDSARTIGDEPLQLFRKFGNEIKVVVGEDRVFAIPNILQAFPDTDVILLDDALQHRSVKPRLTILVTEYSNPFYRDFVLPRGRLREARKGASRSDIIVVTKCNDRLSVEEQNEMTHAIQRYAGRKPIFFSRIQYGSPISFGGQRTLERNIMLVSGIAKVTSLMAFCFSNYEVLRHFNFPDHHRYSSHDLDVIENFCKRQSQPFSIITTEKDMVKLIEPGLEQYIDRLPWFYIPIEHMFLEDGLKFDELIFGSVTMPAKN